MNTKILKKSIGGIVVIQLILLLSLHSTAAENEPSVRPKIGLVLSGGGAKGFAHVGTLMLLDSLGIPVDYIAGTSIGGIAGALYAIGYTGKEIEALAQRTDWEEIFTDLPPRKILPYFQKKETGKYQVEFGMKGVKPITPSGLIYGQKISLLLSSLTFPYEKIEKFDQLPIPFRCVAVDLVTGNEVILKNGSLSKAMRATMAIPTVFSPVEWGDSLLVDGGLINNLPVDIVKKMGADIVIAVDVESPLKERTQLNNALAVLNQTVTLLGFERKRENLKSVDVLIKPDVSGFTAASFDNEKIRGLIERGQVAAHHSLYNLATLKNKYFSAVRDIDSEQQKIQSLQITGHTITPFEIIQQQLNIKENDKLDPNYIENRVNKLKTSGNFDSVEYDVIPISEDHVRVLVRIHEDQKPVIHGIDIENNTQLPFQFIYRLLGLKPGDVLDTKILNQRIMEIYGLGYFELILYNIEPVEDNKVNLKLIVKELPTRKLRVGIRYDNFHKLVGVVNAQATNLLVPGLRLENEFQFAGLYRFAGKAYYPSRRLNFPVYPFLHLEYKNIPTYIYDVAGNRIARYKDMSFMFGIGFGLLFSKFLNIELEYQHEYMDIKPSIAFSDPNLFPEWKDKLRKIQADLHIDLLDDVLLPRRGFLINVGYEGSLKKLKSELDYQLFHFSYDFYYTFLSRHTIRTYAFCGISSSETPVYKFMNQGRPETFVGVKYDQLIGNKLNILRFDYRFQYKKDIFFKIMTNMALNSAYRINSETFNLYNLWGAGLGVKLLSPVGPLEIIYGRGSKNFRGPRKEQDVFYFTFGYKF